MSEARTMMTAAHRVPYAVKIAYTAFMAVLIPVYLYYYGPTNFLFICNIALLLTLVAIWPESDLLLSMVGVAILVVQAAWLVDFLVNLAGVSLTGVTDYMFDARFPLFLRLLSLYHAWIPFLVVYLVWKVGYDRRAFWAWNVLFWVLLLVCFFLMPPPTPNAGLTPVNINYVWGPSEQVRQTWVPPSVWFAGLMLGLPLLVFAPTHFVLNRVVPERT
jgi:hypothetical protein